ncbi:MAG: glutaredoxin family protein [DPANN group archaeon]|nr:glutaredoxin family protein [DPANN group archaeon]
MAKQPRIRIYTTVSCPYCHMAMEWFKQNKVTYEQIDVTTDERKQKEMINLSGQMGVPVIAVGDKNPKIIIGFRADQLRKAILAS